MEAREQNRRRPEGSGAIRGRNRIRSRSLGREKAEVVLRKASIDWNLLNCFFAKLLCTS